MKVLSKRSALVAAAALVASVGGQTLGMSPASAATDIRIGINASQVVAVPTAYAVTKGILQRNGLNPTVTVLNSSELVPQLAAGRIDFTFMPIVQALQARTNAGIDLRIIVASDGFSPAMASRAAKDAVYRKTMDPSGVCGSAAQGITRPKQLEGRTVGVPIRGSFPEIVISDAIRKDGGNPATVKWAVVPPGNMVASIKNGTIEGGYLGSGFVPQCEQEGQNHIAAPTINTVLPQGGPVTAWVTTAAYAKANPQVIAAFQKSMYQTAALLNRDKNKMREAITLSTQYTKAPLESALASPMPHYFTTLTKAMVQNWATIAQKAGPTYLVKAPDVPGILWVQPKTAPAAQQ